MANGQTNISGGKTLVGTAQPSDVRMGMTYADGKELRNGTLDLTNLKAENIRSGVTVGGVAGNFDDSFKVFPHSVKLKSPDDTNVSFTVPNGVHKIQCLIIGAGGCGYYGGDTDNRGGHGSVVFAEFEVSPGQILTGTGFLPEYSRAYQNSHTDGTKGRDTIFNGIVASGGGAGTQFKKGSDGSYSNIFYHFFRLMSPIIGYSGIHNNNMNIGRGISSGYRTPGGIVVFY